jgi:hypothetical protein
MRHYVGKFFQSLLADANLMNETLDRVPSIKRVS